MCSYILELVCVCVFALHRMYVISSHINDCTWFASDVNECEQSPSVCDQNADCMNKAGSYKCTCQTGYSGDGKTCTGTSVCYIRRENAMMGCNLANVLTCHGQATEAGIVLHVTLHDSLWKTITQGTIDGFPRRGRQCDGHTEGDRAMPDIWAKAVDRLACRRTSV